MQRLEVSCAVRRINTSLGAKGLIYYAYASVIVGNCAHVCNAITAIIISYFICLH